MFKIFNRVKENVDPKGFLKDDQKDYIFSTDTTQEPPRSSRKPQTSMVVSQQMVVDYLIVRDGQETSHALVAGYLGSTPAYVTTLMKDLLKKGTITRKGKRGHFVYTVNHSRVNNRRKKRVANTNTPPKLQPMPEVQPQRESSAQKVLNFIARHEDEQITHEDIARGSGTTLSKVSPIVRKLEQEGAIVRSLPVPRHGTRYWLTSSLENGPNRIETVPEKLVVKTTQTDLHNVIDTLVWEYLRECKQTDILIFLEWLKQRK